MNIPQYAASMIWGFIAGGGSASAVVRIFGRRWVDGFLEKKRAAYSKELVELHSRYAKELEAIKANLDRSVFVSKAQFEKELDALMKTFEAATKLNQIFRGLRPLVEIEPADEGEKRSRLDERLSTCIEAYNEFISVYQKLSPFYPQDIHAHFDECAKAANLEIIQIQTAGGRMFKPEWYDQGIKNQERFGVAYQKASRLIRARIAKLAVVGATENV